MMASQLAATATLRPTFRIARIAQSPIKCQRLGRPAAPRLRQLQCRAAQAGFTGDGSRPVSGSQAGGEPSVDAVQALEPPGFLSQVLGAYQNALAKHPVTTKAITSLVGFAIGDRVAQTLGGGSFDALRFLRLSAYGLLIDGPLGHYFYDFLDKRIRPDAPKSMEAVVTKTAIDQLVWAPVMTVVFLVFLTALEGRPGDVASVISAKLLPILLANFSVWPIAHLINFRFVPPEQRILFNNVVAIAWTTYLSMACGAGGGHAGTPRDALAAGLPCAAQAAAVVFQSHHLADAARTTSAVESILQGWGATGMPPSSAGTELILDYVRLKSEVLHAVCGARPPLQ